jgi:hypothetical protein
MDIQTHRDLLVLRVKVRVFEVEYCRVDATCMRDLPNAYIGSSNKLRDLGGGGLVVGHPAPVVDFF